MCLFVVCFSSLEPPQNGTASCIAPGTNQERRTASPEDEPSWRRVSSFGAEQLSTLQDWPAGPEKMDLMN